jgi:3-isopropylmalate dehydrogenase
MMRIFILPGDGIGPEIMAQARRVLDWMAAERLIEVELESGLIGAASLDAFGTPLTDQTLDRARQSDAILFGSVGGPQWDTVPIPLRPERGLLRLRKELDLFANLRHARMFDALIEASPLKPERVKGMDVMIVRELAGGIYFGEPRGIETLPNGDRRGVNTHVYETPEIHRIVEVAFQIAAERRGLVHSVEKGNVMEAGALWREEVKALHLARFGNVKLQQMYADACAMALVRNPLQFDVIVTDNLFGDVLSDEAAEISGSLGMMPTASLGPPKKDGSRLALYEPAHGSAPDIAGQNRANPIAMILSLAMCLRYSFKRETEARMTEEAVRMALEEGFRTPDLAETGTRVTTTSGFGDAVLEMLNRMV